MCVCVMEKYLLSLSVCVCVCQWLQEADGGSESTVNPAQLLSDVSALQKQVSRAPHTVTAVQQAA